MEQELLQALLAQSKKQTFALRLVVLLFAVLCLLAGYAVWVMLPLVDNLNLLIVDVQRNMQLATDSLQSIDIDSLNRAVANLESAVAPLAKFAEHFSF